MAKIHLDRLINQFDFAADEVSGLNYRNMMKDMLANRTLNIARATARISRDNFDKQLTRLKKKGVGKEKIIVLPDVTEALPKRSVFLAKAAQDGNLITDTLRDRLTGDLRRSLKDFRTKETREPSFVRRRGAKAGTINPELIAKFQKDIVQTYSTYTRRHPDFGVPANVHAIAVTEIRSTVDVMKAEYNDKFARKNKDTLRMTKTWVQNRGLAHKPRTGHSMVNGVKIPIGEMFQVPLFKTVRGKEIRIGTTPMKHPHDSSAPPAQIIGCNCDAVYKGELI